MDQSVRSIFRAALLAYVVLAVSYTVKVIVIGPGALPDPAAAYFLWWIQQPHPLFQQVLTWVGNAAGAGSIVAALAMLAFARWARHLFALCIIVLVGADVFIDLPVLTTPIDSFLQSLVGIVAGGIIVFAYWSRVSDAFEKKAT